MALSKIDWPWKPLHTINPVDGCPRGCTVATRGFDCYAKKINDRFKHIPDFSKPVFFPERLEQFKKLKETDACFINSMSDIGFWEMRWKHLTIAAMEISRCEKFLALSKTPWAFEDAQWPVSCMIGLTVTGAEKDIEANIEMFFEKSISGGNHFLSIEPLLGVMPWNMWPECVDWFIVGADSNKGAKPPKKEWIDSVKANCPKEKIWVKPNIKKYWDAT